MEQDKAQVLFEEGGTLVFLGVPKNTEFGIDCNTWHVDTNFRGIKMIPPGLHFIYYSAVNSMLQTAPRTGFFYNFKQREVLVKEWDAVLEDVKDKPTDTETVERITQSKKEMDRYLGAYPYENYKKWISLTGYISEELVETLQPSSHRISSVTQFVSECSTSQSRKKAAEKERKEQDHVEIDENKSSSATLTDLENRLPTMQVVPGTEIRFSDIPRKKYPPGSSPADVTKYSMDSSYALVSMLENSYKGDIYGVLGEIQFAFVCFLVGQVYDAFEQWKKLVHFVCTCEEALNSHTDLFMKFISLMHFQLREIPEDFFVDIVSADNFLTNTLHEFFSNVENSCTDETLKKRAREFCKHLTKKYNWDFESDPEDYAPVVVDLG